MPLTSAPGSETLDALQAKMSIGEDPGEKHLLLEAFDMFTQASSSLERAFHQLQERTRRLSEELAAKNRALKRSLREKEEAQNYLKRILESLPCGVLVVDETGRCTLCNPTADRILHWTGNSRFRSPGKKKARGNAQLQKHPDLAGLNETGGTEIELPLASRDGMRVVATSCTHLTNASGTPAGKLFIIRDITEMKALQEQNKRGEKLSAMGEMAVQLAHEIRNPLGSIELFASLLEKELAGGSDAGRWAENIRIGSRSLNNIVSNMLHFANPLAPRFSEVDVHDLIGEILRFLDPILDQREVRVETRLDAEEPVVAGDRELLKQMTLNLILNSLQAMPSKGLLSISTSCLKNPPGGAARCHFQLIVRDTGLGIPAENLSRIFDPFFTTNRNGTGLGLSVVHQIVDQHSGFIEVESELQRGTTFTILLPGVRMASGAA